MPNITLELQEDAFLEAQWGFICSQAIESVFLGGYGSGKTFANVHKTIVEILTAMDAGGQSNGWMMYPSYGLAEEIFVPEMSKALDKFEIDYDYRKAKYLFETQYGKLKMVSIANPESMIGANLTYCGGDELDRARYRDAKRSYDNAGSRLRGKKNAHQYSSSTPEGFGLVHEICKRPSVEVFRARTTDNDFMPDKEGYVARLVELYGNNPLLISQYINGEFVNVRSGVVYYAFDRDKNTFNTNVSGQALHVGIDFNVSPMTAVIAVIEQGQLKVIDEVYEKNSNTESTAKQIRAKYPSNMVTVYPDASGAARHSSAGITDIKILRDYGFNVNVGSSNPAVIDRINAVNANLCNGKGERRVMIHSGCRHLIEDLEQVTWLETGVREIDKRNPDRTHISDALGYMVVRIFGLGNYNGDMSIETRGTYNIGIGER